MLKSLASLTRTHHRKHKLPSALKSQPFLQVTPLAPGTVPSYFISQFMPDQYLPDFHILRHDLRGPFYATASSCILGAHPLLPLNHLHPTNPLFLKRKRDRNHTHLPTQKAVLHLHLVRIPNPCSYHTSTTIPARPSRMLPDRPIYGSA